MGATGQTGGLKLSSSFFCPFFCAASKFLFHRKKLNKEENKTTTTVNQPENGDCIAAALLRLSTTPTARLCLT